ncbi:MAG: NAD(P)H-binding protein [Bacteroidota bacterium]
MKTAILAGTTGLIGAQVLELLMEEKSYDRIIALSRKPLKKTSEKIINLIVDFDDLDSFKDHLKGDDVFCCLGTTIKQAGSKEAFRKVDLEYPVTLATITKNNGARKFLIVTALGANKRSSIFYNQVKGEVEEKIAALGFEEYHIFQPSMLIGLRKEERAGGRSGPEGDESA